MQVLAIVVATVLVIGFVLYSLVSALLFIIPMILTVVGILAVIGLLYLLSCLLPDHE